MTERDGADPDARREPLPWSAMRQAPSGPLRWSQYAQPFGPFSQVRSDPTRPLKRRRTTTIQDGLSGP
jgi:hypothetical protein